MYVLIVMSFIGGGWTVSMQEFSSDDNCRSAGSAIGSVFNNLSPAKLKWRCEQK
jgi:hypothetical protein